MGTLIFFALAATATLGLLVWSGIELFQSLRAGGVDIPTIFISGRADPGLRRKAMEAGAAAFYEKPVQDCSLMNLIQTAVGRLE